ncbi:hypothetical protein [Porphyromonas crevioricanis]|uniref:Uncharacterized protein n=1 Tax=Porphyromonas crevioricanis JCM 15906 TaxID=1305617 RepID=T1CIW7_9PORP|nr:hypothetical protein [Porphyromonas crevioricanis]GAD06146.1 hypothetical protein PORCRE_1868 [Porphyromonas crevioricanis JCM 15906]SJZ72394.1 hypothetical protein SAMN02745203_00664 [Porphyromonas crevioricanis]
MKRLVNLPWTGIITSDRATAEERKEALGNLNETRVYKTMI